MSIIHKPMLVDSNEPQHRILEQKVVKEESSKAKHICPHCDKAFKKPSRLTWHIRTHTGERPYKCTIENCDRAYGTSSHLKRHVATHDPVQQCFECDVCKLNLRSRLNLMKHYRRVHENEDKLRCKECGVWFRKKSSLEDHIRLHKNVTLDCEKCHKSFSSILKFRRHKKNHEIKYYCKVPGCDAKFEYHLLYRKHCESHEEIDEKREKKLKSRLSAHKHDLATTLLACPYDECYRVYYHQCNLNYHIKTKHKGIKKFECDLCKTQIVDRNSLIRHFRRFHSDVFGVQDDTSLKKPGLKKRKKRFDAGLPKKSMMSKLIGIELPHDMEKMLLKRDTVKICSDKDFTTVENNMVNK